MSPSPTNIDTKYVKTAEDVPAKAELRAADCKKPEQWAQWARERVQYEDPYNLDGRRY